MRDEVSTISLHVCSASYVCIALEECDQIRQHSLEGLAQLRAQMRKVRPLFLFMRVMFLVLALTD